MGTSNLQLVNSRGGNLGLVLLSEVGGSLVGLNPLLVGSVANSR